MFAYLYSQPRIVNTKQNRSFQNYYARFKYYKNPSVAQEQLKINTGSLIEDNIDYIGKIESDLEFFCDSNSVEYKVFDRVRQDPRFNSHGDPRFESHGDPAKYLTFNAHRKALEYIHQDLKKNQIPKEKVYEYVDLVRNINRSEVVYREFELIESEHNRNLSMMFEVAGYGALYGLIRCCKKITYLFKKTWHLSS
jgi:hypothetical protein